MQPQIGPEKTFFCTTSSKSRSNSVWFSRYRRKFDEDFGEETQILKRCTERFKGEFPLIKSERKNFAQNKNKSGFQINFSSNVVKNIFTHFTYQI